MSKNLGTLAVVVLKARNLPNKSLWKQDPYCVVRFDGGGQRTKVDERGGQHPVWDAEFRFPVAESDEVKRLLKISVFTKEHKIDDLIGEAEVDIAGTLAKGEFDDWVKLTRNGRDVGEVYLEMTFYSAAPPIARRPSKLHPSDRLWRPPQTPPKTPSPAHTPQNLPPASTLAVPGQAARPAKPGGLPPAPYERPSPQTKPGGLPPAPYERPAPAPKAKAPAAQPAPADQIPAGLRPHAASPGSSPGAHAKPLPVPSEAPTGAIPYRPPPSVDDFLTAPTAAPAPRTAQQPALQNVPSILRPGHVRQQQQGAALSKAAQEAEDARMAAEMARAEGIDVDRLRAEEADAELARRLASEEGDPSVPGAYN